MSVTMQVITRRRRLPTTAEWRSAIPASGFQIDLRPFEWRKDGERVRGTLLGVPVSLVIALERGASEREPFLEVATGWRRAVVTTWAEGPLGQIVQWCAFAVLRRISRGEAAMDGERVPAAEMWAEAWNAYLGARVLLRRYEAGDLALPWDDPPLLAPEETPEMRHVVLRGMMNSPRRQLEEACGEDGQPRSKLRRRMRNEVDTELKAQADRGPVADPVSTQP